MARKAPAARGSASAAWRTARQPLHRTTNLQTRHAHLGSPCPAQGSPAGPGVLHTARTWPAQSASCAPRCGRREGQQRWVEGWVELLRRAEAAGGAPGSSCCWAACGSQLRGGPWTGCIQYTEATQRAPPHLSVPTGMYPSLAPTSSVIVISSAASPTHARMLLQLRQQGSQWGEHYRQQWGRGLGREARPCCLPQRRQLSTQRSAWRVRHQCDTPRCAGHPKKPLAAHALAWQGPQHARRGCRARVDQRQAQQVAVAKRIALLVGEREGEGERGSARAAGVVCARRAGAEWAALQAWVRGIETAPLRP